MTMHKIAVSIPPKTLASARRAVRAGKAKSLSGYITRVIDQAAMDDDLGTMLEEMLRETGGPMTAAEKRFADSALAGYGKKNPSRRKK